MTQTKKKTLTFLGITIILLAAFIISFVGQGNENIASADSTTSTNPTVQQLDGVMSNGKAPASQNNTGTAIYTVSDLQNFLSSGSGRGYLANDITNFSWNGRLTSTLSSVNMTELDGNGHTVYLTASNISDSPAKHIDTDLTKNDKGNISWTMFMSTFFAGENTKYTNYVDLHGGLIGFLRNYQTIRNCKFVYTGNINVSGTAYKTGNSVSMGLIAGLSLGTINNCSLTVNGSVNVYKDSTYKGSVLDTGTESRTQHTFAMGGFAGAMTSSNAVVSNSKLIFNGSFAISVRCKLEGGAGYTEYRNPHARAFAGGVAGWCANSAKIFNIVTEGNGTLDARGVNDSEGRSRSFTGIIAGITGGDNAGGQTSLAGLIDACGTINGVINKWTGHAKFLTNDTQYSPTGDNENDIQYLIVGVIGRRDSGSTSANVTDIFMTKKVYSGTTFSIAFDYDTAEGTNGRNRGRYYSTNIFIEDVLDKSDGSEDFTTASDNNAYLAFSGDEEDSPLWAVYDLKSNNNILWSKSVTNNSTNRTDLEYYYDQATSIEDAKKFTVTHTEIPRGGNENYTIQYAHGKAVYFKQTYSKTVIEENTETGDVTLDFVRYGESLTAPGLRLYYDKDCTEYNFIRTLTDKSYWVSVGSKSNVPVRMSAGIVSPDTYKSFLFLESSGGRNYNYIQFVNTTYRYVSYIYDDPTYIKYASEHEGYSPVRGGQKQIDWQQRITQEVKPKQASIEWGYDSDITENEDSGRIYDQFTGAITSYGQYTTTYDGDAVVFSTNIPSSTLMEGDTCSAIYEYRMLDNYTGEYSKVDSCVNAGTYKVVVTGLTNTNYELSMGSTYADYSIDFVILQRQIGFINSIDAEQDGDTYYIEVPYEARDLTLADEVVFFANKTQAEASNAKIKIYNVLEKDRDIIRFDYIACDDEELDMRNVGKFEMRMSLQSGINAGNYALPEVTKYIVQITEADVILSNQKKFEYPYGFFVKDRVEPFVTATGVDGLELTFDGFEYFKKEADGEYHSTPQEPFDSGDYKITYHFLNSAYTNYKDADITVQVTIKPREVTATFTTGDNTQEVDYGKTIDSIGVTFERQRGERGIFAYEYSSNKAVFKFNKLDENGYPTDIWVDKAVDAGEYLVEVSLDFIVGTTSSGWQINENTKYNYQVVYTPITVVINKRTVYIDINEVNREYGDALPTLTGDANAADKVRAWKYTTLRDEEANKNNFFFDDDNIVLKPQLSTTDIYEFVGKYSISIPNDTDHRMGKKVEYKNKEGEVIAEYDQINNYVIVVSNKPNNELYIINPRTVKVKVNLNTNSVIYGDDLPEYIGYTVIGEKDFIEDDGIELVDFWDGVEVGSPVRKDGTPYVVVVNIKEMDNNMHKNYKLVVEEATFDITPRTLTIIGAELEGDKVFDYDGSIHKPSVIATFAEEVFGGDVIDFNYSYFEIVDGVMSTEATEKPSYAGTYRAFISDASNDNYTVVFGEEYERIEIIMTINKRNVSIDVLPAYRVYSIADSLTPIIRPYLEGGGIHEEDGYHYYTQDEAIEIDRERFLAPFEYADDNEDEFVQDYEYLKATMYIDEYYRDLGVKYGVVKIVFNGLERDPNFLDEEGNWITEEAVDSHGDTIQIIVPRYRNYNITINPGDLHVIGANLSNVTQFVNLRSSEEVYNGQDRYEDFRVITSNETIFNALKFRVFRYVAISSLSKTDADASIKAYGKYTREQVDGVYVYTRNDEEGTYVRKYLRRKENGDTVDDKLADAGQYFKHVTPADPNIFEGEYIMPFYITKAAREVSADDIKVTVNYDRISITSKIDGMEVSFNGAGFVNRNTFVDLKPNTDYVVKVRFTGTANYLQSNEIVLNLHTGIDISAIQSTLDKYEKIDFSNINEYESKVLAFINSVSQEDKSRLDQAKYAKLQASYEQLLRGANSVVEGAQKAGATAVGKSGKTSTTATKAVALSMSGAGVLMAGFMFFAKRKKDDEQDIQVVKKAKSVSIKKASKVIVMTVAVILVCLTVFAGCDPAEDDGAFTKADLYKIASYQGDAQTGSRDLTIQVTSGGTTLYKYADGKEEIDPRLDVSSISFGADGVGFEFDDLYFTNSEFTVEGEAATFKADVKETLVFLGVDRATNGKVSVVVNTATKKLNTIDVTYDVVNAGITYNVAISVKAK